MKLKIFKDFKNIKKVYWKIPTGKKFEIALKKLNIPKGTPHLNLNLKNQDFIFVRHGKFNARKNEWGMSSIEKTYIDANFKYAGEIVVYDYEVDSEKYNL